MRDNSIDAIKGLAIIGVIIIHSTTGEQFFYFNQFLDVFFKFCVPLFIFISGYFVYKNRMKIEKDFSIYLKRRLFIVGYPYFLMNIIIAIFEQSDIITFLKKLFTGTASVPYYFVIVIFQLYILSKILLCMYKKNYKLLISISIVSILLYSFLFYLQLLIKGQIVIPYFMFQFPNYLLWFILGMEFCAQGKIFILINKIKVRTNFLLFFSTLLLCFIEVFLLRRNNLQDGDYIAFSSILWEFSAIITFWKIKSRFDNKFFVTLGRYSFGIFLIHFPLMNLYFQFFNQKKYPEYGLLYAFIVISVCLLLLKLIEKVRVSCKSIINTFINSI